MDNQIGNSKALFDDAVNAVKAAVGAKPIWITETGFPTTGKASGAATPSKEDAKKYWDQVYCSFKGQVNIWWYTLLDSGSNPSFGVIGGIPGEPLYDLSCKDVSLPPPPPPPPAGSSSVVPPTSAAVPTTSPTGSTGGSTGGSSSVPPPAGTTSPPAPTVGGGSPGTGGNGGAVPSSILTIQTSKPPTGSNGTIGQPQPTGPATIPPNAAAAASSSFGGAFLAVMAAILIL